MDAQLQLIPIEQIKAAPDNVRTEPGDVTELAKSIEAIGVLEPLLATKTNGGYTLVAGGRRLAGAQLAGLDAVPVIVREFDDRTRVEAMLIENLQRHDLSTLEEARAYRRLVDFGLSQRELADRIGRSQAHVSKRLALLELPDEVAAQVDSGGITLADAGQLTKLKDSPELVLEAIAERPPYRSMEDQVEDMLERKERDDKIAAAAAEAEADGLRVVTMKVSTWGAGTLPKGAVKISKSGSYDSIKVDVDKHATLDCHAVAIDPQTFERIAVCTDRKKAHPNAKTQAEKTREQYASQRPGGGLTKEQREQQQRDEEELEAANERRKAFYGTLVNGKHAKSDVVDVVLHAFVQRACEYNDVDVEIAALALGLDIEKARWDLGKLVLEHAAKGEKELVQTAHALALAGPEVESFYSSAWSKQEREHIQMLVKHGYELSDIEKRLLEAT